MQRNLAWQNSLSVSYVFGLMLALTSPLIAQTTPPQAAPVKAFPAPTPGPFASEIVAFETADKKALPPTGGVLFIGSSSIRYWTDLVQDFPEIPVINRGFGGSIIEHSTLYADRIVLPYKPKLVLLYAGGNDINGGKSPEQVLVDFGLFAAKVQQALPETTVAFISINPSLARWKQESDILRANSLIEKYIRDTNSPTRKLAFVASHAALLGPDGQPQAALLRDDHLHLNAEGYKAWKAIIKPQILALADAAGIERQAVPPTVK